ncbi:MAG: hypothetical protein IT443_11895 [Phycisphaeraceae bacterium]|nr:hypothetical protein [Phycisphaeraceae bacterium]
MISLADGAIIVNDDGQLELVLNGYSLAQSASGLTVDLAAVSGLEILTSDGLALKYDNATLGVNGSNQAYVKDDGVGSAQLGILTTKGDLIGFSTVPLRVGIGTDGQVLTADAASSPGLKWATLPPGMLDRSLVEQASGFTDRNGADVYEITVDFGALPDTTSDTTPHGITGLNVSALVEIVAWASDGTTVLPLPWTDGTDALAIEVDATNITVTSNFDASAFTLCEVFLRYTKASGSGFDSGFDSGFGA